MATRADRLPRRSPLATAIASWRRRAPGEDELSVAEVGRPRPVGFVALVGLVMVLNVVGLVMVLSSSHVDALHRYGSSWVFFQRQVLWVGAGSVALLVAARVDYGIWRRLTVPLLATSLVLLALVLVPGTGISVNGSSRWLGIGQWRMQPSELAKLAVLVFIADLLARRCDHLHDTRRTTRPVLIIAVSVTGLVMLQPDMGTTLVVACIVSSLLFVGGVPVLVLGKTFAWATAAAVFAAFAEPYRRERVLSFLDPWKDKGNTGYQAVQALVGLGSGGLAGVGLGASRAKWGFLPNAHTDFIFAIIGEELGLLGSLVVLGLFIAFAIFGVRAALRAPDRFGMLMAAGVTAWVIGQALLNIGAVIGMVPITGVPLPFVSFGGSSLVVLMGAVGILLNIARQGR